MKEHKITITITEGEIKLSHTGLTSTEIINAMRAVGDELIRNDEAAIFKDLRIYASSVIKGKEFLSELSRKDWETIRILYRKKKEAELINRQLSGKPDA